MSRSAPVNDLPAWWTGDVLSEYGRRVVARKLGLSGADMAEWGAVLRAVQRRHGLPVTGVVDEATARLLGEEANAETAPPWWTEGLSRADVAAVAGVDDAALRRMEGQCGRPPGAVPDIVLARALERRYGPF